MRGRRDLLLLCLIAGVALGIRLYFPWHTVFQPSGVDFLETDAWYHVRLIENQVRNFPHRVTVDPYAAPGGQFVPIAPFLDTSISTAVWLVHGRDAATADIERIAAFAPPVFGALTVVAIFVVAWFAFGRREALLAAAMTAVLPGHFLDRTLLGFVDHHALEALWSAATLAGLAWALARPGTRAPEHPAPEHLAPRHPGTGAPRHLDARAPEHLALRHPGTRAPEHLALRHPGTRAPRHLDARGLVAGLALGSYLLSWGSGAFLVAVIAVWLAMLAVLAREAESLLRAARVSVVMLATAFVLVVVFQDPAMYRYDTQIVALAGALCGAGVLAATGRWVFSIRRTAFWMLVGLAVAVTIALTLTAWMAPRFSALVTADLSRFLPNPERMAVLEARPLFLYSGVWDWAQPWIFFRTGFFVGLAGMVGLGMHVARHRRSTDALICLWAVVTLVATVGQNRFGYYLVPAFALTGAWLAARVLDWGGVPHAGNPTPVVPLRFAMQREIAVILVAGCVFAPNLVPAVMTTTRTQRMPGYWRDAMIWLRNETPPPFPEGYYTARYSPGALRLPDWTVMNWWDQGYWISQAARRVPVSNPTQAAAGLAGRFFAETDPAAAREMLRDSHVRYVLADWEMPFRLESDGTVLGHFESIVDWAGHPRTRYYEVLWRRAGTSFEALWVFHPDYYRSMAYRLSVFGGAAGQSGGDLAVVTWRDLEDANGDTFREAVTVRRFDRLAAAEAHLAAHGSANDMLVGLDPWRTPFDLPAVPFLVQDHAVRTDGQDPGEAPWVRVLRVADP